MMFLERSATSLDEPGTDLALDTANGERVYWSNPYDANVARNRQVLLLECQKLSYMRLAMCHPYLAGCPLLDAVDVGSLYSDVN